MYSKEKTLKIDKQYIWHPFTQMKDYENRDHVVIASAKGVKLYDIDGNEYYDTISSWWTNTLGHCNKRLNKAMMKQLETIEHVNFSGFTHPYAAELVDLLKGFLPKKLNRFFFSDNGSTSVEVAVKMAFQYWQNQGKKKKKKFVMLKEAYHGDTLGAVSVSGVDEYHKLYKPLMFESIEAPSPDYRKRQTEFTYDAWDCRFHRPAIEKMQQILHENSEDLAAVIVEPLLMGAGGMRVYHPEYLNRLRELCDEYDVLLILDEVATGFGRTGTFFAMEQASIVPDIVCLSKGITAGYMPLSLTVCTKKVYDAFYDDYSKGKTFFHGHSYTANPLACSVAIESLKIMKEQELPYSRHKQIRFFHEKLREFAKYDFIGDIRYIGFVGALDLVKSRKKKLPFEESDRIGHKIYEESLKNGVVLRPLGDTIYFWLPLIVKKKHIAEIFERTQRVLLKVVNSI